MADSLLVRLFQCNNQSGLIVSYSKRAGRLQYIQEQVKIANTVLLKLVGAARGGGQVHELARCLGSLVFAAPFAHTAATAGSSQQQQLTADGSSLDFSDSACTKPWSAVCQEQADAGRLIHPLASFRAVPARCAKATQAT